MHCNDAPGPEPVEPLPVVALVDVVMLSLPQATSAMNASADTPASAGFFQDRSMEVSFEIVCERRIRPRLQSLEGLTSTRRGRILRSRSNSDALPSPDAAP